MRVIRDDGRLPSACITRKRRRRTSPSSKSATRLDWSTCDSSLRPKRSGGGVRLTFLPFIIKAVTDALRRHPVLNSSVDEQTNELVYKKYYNIGVATATESGLMVPVVQNADRLRLLELAKRIERLSRSARDGTLAPEDLRNSTFTVTSLGKQGGAPFAYDVIETLENPERLFYEYR